MAPLVTAVSRPAPAPQSQPPVAARFALGPSKAFPMKEASDVVSLPGGAFLIVGDRSDKVLVVDAAGKARKLELPGLKSGNSQLEGVAYDPVRHHLLVSREEKREILRYEWNAEKDSAPKLEKTFTLKKGDGPVNKGVEGLAYLPGSASPTGSPQLLAAREGKPRQLMLLGDGGGGDPITVHLDDRVLAMCKDVSAVAVDPITGDIFVSSDESSSVVQLKLVRDGKKLVGRFVSGITLKGDDGKKLPRIEGLTFSAKGDLYVLTENDGTLHKLIRQ